MVKRQKTATINDDDVAINLRLLKLCGFYKMIDLTCKKIYNHNVYQLSYIVLTLIIQCALVLGNVGLFIETEDTYNQLEYFLCTYNLIQIYLSLLKLCTLFYHTGTIWKLIDMSRFDFFRSKLCKKNISILYKSRNKNLIITYLYFICTIMVGSVWQIFPLWSYMFAVRNNNKYYKNILNLRFPINKHIYNQYYFIFFIVEWIIFINALYQMIVTEIFFITFSYVIIGQYELLEEIIKNIGHENGLKTDNQNDCTTDYDNLKMILSDQQLLCSYVKSFYSVIWIIILFFISFTSSAVIVLAYALILIFSSEKLFSIRDLLIISSGLLYVIILLFVYCYFIGTINEKQESVNFAIYSCNWTEKDLKFKKLVLLAMRMNDVNQLILRVSPKKVIDMKLFASVMTTCYNVVSVMVKTIKFKNK